MTNIGNDVHRIANLDGKLYLSYGDYGANTGPIDVIVVDPADDTISSEATLNTEATWLYREFDGVKFVAYLDPQGGEGNPENGQFAYNDSSGWVVLTNVSPYPVHVDDLYVTAEGWWLFGSSNEPDPPTGGATVWLSTDEGATWEVSLAPRPDTTGQARFVAACVLDGDLHAVLDRGFAVGGRHIYRRTAGTWVEVEPFSAGVSDLVPFTIGGIEFALVVTIGKQYSLSAAGLVAVLTTAADAGHRESLRHMLPATAFCASVVGGFLYVLDSHSTLWRVDSSGHRTPLMTLEVALVSCFAIVGSTVYFGTQDSKIYKAALP